MEATVTEVGDFTISNRKQEKEILSKKSRKRLYCKNFIDFLTSKDRKIYWENISVMDIREGDILFCSQVNDDRRINHCMIIYNVKKINTEEIMLEVIDSTSSPHRNDTRREGANGIGIGEISLYKSIRNKFELIRWRDNVDIRNIYVGRVIKNCNFSR